VSLTYDKLKIPKSPDADDLFCLNILTSRLCSPSAAPSRQGKWAMCKNIKRKGLSDNWFHKVCRPRPTGWRNLWVPLNQDKQVGAKSSKIL